MTCLIHKNLILAVRYAVHPHVIPVQMDSVLGARSFLPVSHLKLAGWNPHQKRGVFLVYDQGRHRPPGILSLYLNDRHDVSPVGAFLAQPLKFDIIRSILDLGHLECLRFHGAVIVPGNDAARCMNRLKSVKDFRQCPVFCGKATGG